MITPTLNEKREWHRFASAAYRIGRNSLGHLFSAAASLPHDRRIDVRRYDQLQRIYRNWLAFGEIEP